MDNKGVVDPPPTVPCPDVVDTSAEAGSSKWDEAGLVIVDYKGRLEDGTDNKDNLNNSSLLALA